jgi:hypothetical protein
VARKIIPAFRERLDLQKAGSLRKKKLSSNKVICYGCYS